MKTVGSWSINHPILLGDLDDLLHIRFLRVSFIVFLIGAVFAVCLYNLAFSLIRYSSTPYLAIGGICLALRMMMVEPNVRRLFHEFPIVWVKKIEFLLRNKLCGPGCLRQTLYSWFKAINLVCWVIFIASAVTPIIIFYEIRNSTDGCTYYQGLTGLAILVNCSWHSCIAKTVKPGSCGCRVFMLSFIFWYGYLPLCQNELSA